MDNLNELKVGLTAAVFAVCYLAIKTVMSVPFACYAFTGTRLERANKTCNWVYTVRCLKSKVK